MVRHRLPVPEYDRDYLDNICRKATTVYGCAKYSVRDDLFSDTGVSIPLDKINAADSKKKR